MVRALALATAAVQEEEEEEEEERREGWKIDGARDDSVEFVTVTKASFACNHDSR